MKFAIQNDTAMQCHVVKKIQSTYIQGSKDCLTLNLKNYINNFFRIIRSTKLFEDIFIVIL